ncbi:hypothetical protein [Streptomyces formicae]|uniref:Fibronectin type-III domain-containing protein n=1 Tax=Streptomyces formicae TaxID=1616117 RepID=A0ABY3WKC9_9ACTN|nr:hypothetical protein [Streptomyces formicae]UNM13036.1 hypothetical protein J4032_17355 [Streptomyces formicae]
MAASGEEIRISLEGGRIPAPSTLAVNKNNELTWEASGADEQTSFLLTFVGDVSKREVTAAAGTTKAAIPTDLAETRYLVEARAVKNGNYSPPTTALKISVKTSAPESLKIDGLSEPQGIATAGRGIYIANRKSGEIIKADMDGKNAIAVKKLEIPMGIATDGARVWVATQAAGGAVTSYFTYGDYAQSIKPAQEKPGINYLSYFGADIYHSATEKYSDPLLFTSQSKGWVAQGYLAASCGEIVNDLSDPRGMTCDGTFLYIASVGRGKVLRVRVDGAGGKVDFISVTNPEDVSCNARHLYVTTNNGTLIRASRHTGVVDDGFTIRNLDKPRGVVVWGNYIYFVEQGANKVSRVFDGWAAE